MATILVRNEDKEKIIKKKKEQERMSVQQSYMNQHARRKNYNKQFTDEIIRLHLEDFPNEIIAKKLKCKESFVEEEIARYINGQATHTTWRSNKSCTSVFLHETM